MKKINIAMITVVLGVLIFAACNKTNNGPTLTPKEMMLTGRIWRLSALTVPAKSNPAMDSSISLPCSDSALMAFDMYHTFQLANAAKACDSTIVPYDLGKWQLSTTGDTLLLDGNKKKLTWRLQILNDTIIKATFRDSIAPNNVWQKNDYFKVIAMKGSKNESW